jgi:hypothetical protein
MVCGVQAGTTYALLVHAHVVGSCLMHIVPLLMHAELWVLLRCACITFGNVLWHALW